MGCQVDARELLNFLLLAELAIICRKQLFFFQDIGNHTRMNGTLLADVQGGKIEPEYLDLADEVIHQVQKQAIVFINNDLPDLLEGRGYLFGKQVGPMVGNENILV